MAKIKQFGKSKLGKEPKTKDITEKEFVNKFVDDGVIAAEDSIKVHPTIKPHVEAAAPPRPPVVPIERDCDMCGETYSVMPFELVGRNEFWRCSDCVREAMKKINRRR